MIQSSGESESNLATITEQQARDWIFRRLALREHSRDELTKGLKERGLPKPQIEALLDSFTQAGYQSDERFQEAYARHQAKQGKGSRWIQMKLKEKGVVATTEKLAEIAQEATGVSELDRAVDFLRRRYQTQVTFDSPDSLEESMPESEAEKRADRQRQRNRLLGALVRRGYSFETAQRAFRIYEDFEKSEKHRED